MKYKLEEQKSEETIKYYKIKNDKLIVYYFDGSKKEIKYTKEFELIIQKKMLEQIEFIIFHKDSNCFKNEIILLLISIAGVTTTSLSSKHLPYFSTLEGQIFNIALYLLYSGAFTFATSKIIKDKLIESEMKKHKLILSKIKESENLTYEGININNIDNYSIKKIQRVLK